MVKKYWKPVTLSGVAALCVSITSVWIFFDRVSVYAQERYIAPTARSIADSVCNYNRIDMNKKLQTIIDKMDKLQSSTDRIGKAAVAHMGKSEFKKAVSDTEKVWCVN